MVSLAHDSELRNRMGLAGRKRAEQRFDEDKVLDLEAARFAGFRSACEGTYGRAITK
jgi:hypothetical protein